MKIQIGKAKVDVPWSFADRVRAFINPVQAAGTLKERAIGSIFGGYTGGAPDRRSMRNWWTREVSANSDISPDLPRLRTRSRDLVRNTPLATGAIATVVTNVVGDGLVLKSQVDRKVLGLSEEEATAWQEAAEREFAIWAKRPDFTDRLNFDGLQQLVLRAVLESGDVFVVRRRRLDPNDTYGLKLLLVEADRVSNQGGKPNTETLVDGVEHDASGRPVAYWISSHHPADLPVGASRTWRRFDKGSTVSGSPLILHLYNQLRIDQARGVPYLAPVIETLKQLGDYSHAEATAAVTAAMFTVFITRPASELDDAPVVGSDTEGNIDPRNEITLAPGAVVDLAQGEKPEFANPGRPNTAFDGFVMAVCRHIGVALQLPVEVLLKSFNSSYSASRAALECAWQFFRERRSWMAWNFCQPVYEWVITEAVVQGRLEAPGFFSDPVLREAWLGSDWIGASRIQLDPQKEASADLIDLQMNVKTREQIMMERTGGSFDAKAAQLAREKQALDAAGLTTATSVSQALQPGGSQQQASTTQQDGNPQP